MFRNTCLALAVLGVGNLLASAAGTQAAAQQISTTIPSGNGTGVQLAQAGNSARQPFGVAFTDDRGLVTIFSNLATKYPNAVYIPLFGQQINGTTFQANYPVNWAAGSFTPTANHTVTRIEIPLELGSGTNSVVLTLNRDNAGLPGAVIKTWNVTDLPATGSCCGLKVVNDAAGIPVTQGQRYWIVVKSNSKDSNAYILWNDQTTNFVDDALFAHYCSDDSGGTCDTNDAWYSNSSLLNPAFAVLGSN